MDIHNREIAYPNVQDHIDFLQNLKDHEENWDGYGAVPPSEQVIANSIHFLKNLNEKLLSHLEIDNITPTTHGTIDFQWENDDDEYVSVEIGETLLGYMSENKEDGLIYEDDLPVNDKERIIFIKELIEKVI